MGQCPYVHDNTACKVGDVEAWIQSSQGCALKGSCNYNVPYLDDSHCSSGIYQGAQYIQVHYQCQGGKHNSIHVNNDYIYSGL